MNGRPCITGTNIPTSLIAGMWRKGLDDGGIRTQFPELTRQQIEAAVQYENRLQRRVVNRVRRFRHRLATWLHLLMP